MLFQLSPTADSDQYFVFYYEREDSKHDKGLMRDVIKKTKIYINNFCLKNQSSAVFSTMLRSSLFS